MKEGRAKAFMVECPKCGAPPGASCRGKWRLRKSPHKARLTAGGHIQLQPLPVKAPASPVQQESFYKTDEWRRLRYIRPRSRFPELELDLSNLQVLCEDCNLGKGGWDSTDWRPDGTKLQ